MTTKPADNAADLAPRQAVVLDIAPEADEPAGKEAGGREAELEAFRVDVLAGLARPQKAIPSKYLYDARGAELFERITRQPEYYPTSTEMDLLERHGADIARRIGPGATIVEPGSGAGDKVRLLLGALEKPAAYVPVDIAKDQLRAVAHRLNEHFAGIRVIPLWADFTHHIEVPDAVACLRPRLVFFPGSTIGNFLPLAQQELLAVLAELAGGDGALLVGFDRIKDLSVLVPAYDDAAGVTAEFELNLLDRINRELGGDFDRELFAYRASWNERERCIEMHLVAKTAHQVEVAGRTFRFEQDETIWNESSYKYDDTRIADLAATAGLRVADAWTDRRGYFTLALLEPDASK
ncbi:MAG: L-histidine N(alpha)-methyltransferase [Planctomycetota bacterium]